MNYFSILFFGSIGKISSKHGKMIKKHTTANKIFSRTGRLAMAEKTANLKILFYAPLAVLFLLLPLPC
jgi:hypothetical protein